MSTVETKRNGARSMPPYLSIAKLSQLLNLVSTRKFDEIKPSDLVHYGFGETDSYIAVTALRFLGLVDSKNHTQESMRSLQLQGDARTQALEKMVRTGYAMIFDRVTDPSSLQDAELHNEFLVTYGITPRIARSAVPAFVWLCEQAELRQPNVAKEPARKAAATSKSLHRSATPAKRLDVADVPGSLNFEFKGGIRLVIPAAGSDVTTAVAQGELKGISDEIIKFAEKYLKSEEADR